MKKHLLAAAVAAAVAAPAFAQNVTVYGRLDQSYVSTKTTTGASTTKTTNTGLDGGVAGSRLGFRGSEDLGGGLKAGFVLEFGVDNGENTGVGATRLGFAEVSGGFGAFRMGRQVTPTKAVTDAYNPTGNSSNFAPGDVSAAIVDLDNRISNAITYMTPNLNGFTAQIQFADSVTESNGSKTSDTILNGSAGATGTKTAGTVDGWRVTQQGNMQGLGLNYAAGPLGIAYARYNQDQFNANVKTETDRQIFAVSYDFGAAKVALEQSMHEQKVAGAKTRDREVTTIGVTIPMGAVVLNAQYFDGDRKGFASGDTTAADYSGYKLRANYNLSKRTALYAQMGETETKPANGTAKTKLEGYNLGLVHTF